MKISLLHILLFLGSSVNLQANNVQVSNVGYAGDLENQEDNFEILFDISWENSWRTSTYESNYDAVWVFAKYRSQSIPDWTHAHITGSVGAQPLGVELIFPSDKMGVFVQRSADGIGDISFENIQLDWELEDFFELDDKIEICVFAIEMVYIPEGPFWAGDGTNYVGFANFVHPGSSDAYQISSEGALLLGGTLPTNLTRSGNGAAENPDDFNSSSTRLLPAAYPKGYQEFYIMKYELSQGQYAEFLNQITGFDFFNDLTLSSFISNGQSIGVEGLPSIYIAEAPERAANFILWYHLAVYADWSGLRPMSELEFEKACRGSKDPVELEYAWGNNRRTTSGYEFGPDGTGEEVVLNPSRISGNIIDLSTLGGEQQPKRCGLFAASIENGSRQDVGATYYGVLEMSGNVSERVVSLGTPQGRAFEGNDHGDGSVYSNVASWPVIDFDPDFNWPGTGLRGGGFIGLYFTVSDRRYANVSNDLLRRSSSGGRLVRSNF